MKAFQSLLVLIWVALAAYTTVVIANHGGDFFAPFFDGIFKMGWAGQFNLDFSCMLTLAGLWVAWRHRFSGLGILFGLCVFFGGGWFFSTYLLVVSAGAGNDMQALLLGSNRVA